MYGFFLLRHNTSNAKVVPDKECEFENASNLRVARLRAVLLSKESSRMADAPTGFYATMGVSSMKPLVGLELRVGEWLLVWSCALTST